jgi:diguanylate cyclase (GGDEF)-like protein
MLYDPAALEPTFVAKCILTAPIYAGVGLVVVLAKRALVAARNESRTQALLDPLTGLANRRALTKAIETSRGAAPLALVLIDIDDFKLANTLHGYTGGDEVLRCAAEVLRRETRHDDLVARLGGDEFALLVSGAGEDQLTDLSQRIVDAMRRAEPEVDDSSYDLTASVGFAILEGNGVDELLESADRQLRRAKRAGKDRWGAATPLRTPR